MNKAIQIENSEGIQTVYFLSFGAVPFTLKKLASLAKGRGTAYEVSGGGIGFRQLNFLYLKGNYVNKKTQQKPHTNSKDASAEHDRT